MNVSQNAKFAIVIANAPKYATVGVERQTWNSFLESLPQIETPIPGVERPTENLWQIDLQNGLLGLSKIIAESANHQIPIRLLFLDDAPDWILFPPPAEKAFGATVVESQRPPRRLPL